MEKENMSKLNIIQRRELEPLMEKANKIIKHYEKAANCCAFVIKSDLSCETDNFDTICSRCLEKKCLSLHIEAISKARLAGGSYIYNCQKGFVFWTSPFYSGERFAGALLSGGVKQSEKNKDRVKALAQLMLICASQISGMSFIQKNVNSVNPCCFQPNYETKGAQNKTGSETENYISAGNPLDLERSLLASLRRGDNAEGQKILKELLMILYQDVKSFFPAFRLKAIELAVLLSRAVSDPKHIRNNTSLETTEHYLKLIEKSSSFDEIAHNLSSITDRMSGMIFSFHGVRHFTAIRKAERFIWKHYTRKLSLKEIANASGLSAPYFSTVFREEKGENLSNYLNRLRVERAAAMLISTDIPISQIAKTCGFEDQSWFSKIFKNNTSFTPGKYRELGIHADCITTDCMEA
jgi:AraC-like DNA-binding protein